MKSQTLLTLALCSTSLLACPEKDGGSDTGETFDPILVAVDGGGVACLEDDGNDDTSTGLMRVTLSDCLSGCAHDVSAGCEATVMDGRLEVVAWGEYSLPGNPEMDCPAVCVEMIAECDVTGLDESVTEMEYDEFVAPLDFPASANTCAPLDD